MAWLFRPRIWFLLVAVACAALLGYGYYVQHVLFIDPLSVVCASAVGFHLDRRCIPAGLSFTILLSKGTGSTPALCCWAPLGARQLPDAMYGCKACRRTRCRTVAWV